MSWSMAAAASSPSSTGSRLPSVGTQVFAALVLACFWRLKWRMADVFATRPTPTMGILLIL